MPSGVAGDWGELQGTDAAAMVEVVEHLDPDALLAAGPALLGGLRPKIAIVTTPNIEYNPVRSNDISVGRKLPGQSSSLCQICQLPGCRLSRCNVLADGWAGIVVGCACTMQNALVSYIRPGL